VKRVAFAVPTLGSSQFAYSLIRQANLQVATRSADVAVFFESAVRPCIQPAFACMQLAEGWNYDGVVVATSLQTARAVLNFPHPKSRYFYVWDLEWLRYPCVYRDVQAIYGSPQLRLIARSQDHAELIEDVWNTRVHGIAADFKVWEVVDG